MFNTTSLNGSEYTIISQSHHYRVFIAPLLLLIEESGIPLPVPGDIYVAYMGYQVARGTISFLAAFIILLITVLIGASILYYLASRFGNRIARKFGHFLHLDEKKLITVEKWFRKYGPLVIIFGRHIPGFRIPITIFAGMSDVPYPTFIVSTFISVVFWIMFYLSLGQRLGPKTAKLFQMHHGYYLFLAIPFIATIVWYLFSMHKSTHNKKQRKVRT